MLKIKVLKPIEYCVVLLFMMTIVSGFFKDEIPVLSYADELILGVLVVFFLFKCIKEKRFVDNSLLLVIFIFLILGGVFSYNSSLQKSDWAIWLDMYSWCKLIVVFYIGYYYLETDSIERIYNSLLVLSKLIIFFSILLVIPNQLFDWDLGGKGSRFGLVSFAFPGMHVAFTIGLVALMVSLLSIKYKKNILWIILAAIVGLSTARFKAFGWELFSIVYIFFQSRNMKLLPVIISVFGVIGVFSFAFDSYFLDDGTSRAMEMLAALSILKDYFPYGAGFGTFGTTMSFQFYSDAYELYGLSQRYGYMETAGVFIGDGGWSTQFAQFGVIGTLIFIIIIYVICKTTIVNADKKGNIIPAVFIVSYLILASVSERIFSGDIAPYIAIVMVIVSRLNIDEIK